MSNFLFAKIFSSSLPAVENVVNIFGLNGWLKVLVCWPYINFQTSLILSCRKVILLPSDHGECIVFCFCSKLHLILFQVAVLKLCKFLNLVTDKTKYVLCNLNKGVVLIVYQYKICNADAQWHYIQLINYIILYFCLQKGKKFGVLIC
jgi:hypothetical protein